MVFPKLLKKFKAKMSTVPTEPYPAHPYPGGEHQPFYNPELIQWFNAVDEDGSGQITWDELQKALLDAQGGEFSDTACKMLIEMCDKNRTGTIDFEEFQHLFGYVNQWVSLFRTFDSDGSGFIEEAELLPALHRLGFAFSPEFVKFLVTKYSPLTQQISIDDFIVMCIQIQRLTDAFRSRDADLKGIITIGYEDFMHVTLNCTSV